MKTKEKHSVETYKFMGEIDWDKKGEVLISKIPQRAINNPPKR